MTDDDDHEAKWWTCPSCSGSWMIEAADVPEEAWRCPACNVFKPGFAEGQLVVVDHPEFDHPECSYGILVEVERALLLDDTPAMVKTDDGDEVPYPGLTLYLDGGPYTGSYMVALPGVRDLRDVAGGHYADLEFQLEVCALMPSNPNRRCALASMMMIMQSQRPEELRLFNDEELKKVSDLREQAEEEGASWEN